MKSKWISIGQAEPPYGEPVLITWRWGTHKEVSVAFLELDEAFDEEIWREVSTPCLPPDAEIIAWMPMPKPYEESEENENA